MGIRYFQKKKKGEKRKRTWVSLRLYLARDISPGLSLVKHVIITTAVVIWASTLEARKET